MSQKNSRLPDIETRLKPVEKPLKMKALMEATGATKATILHYVQQELIPQPERTSQNMAYYHPSSVRRIKLIKYLQSRYRLPLTEIKKIIKEQDNGKEVSPFIEMKEMIFGKQDVSLMTKNKFCEQSGLTEELLDACIEAELIIPKKDGEFDVKDLAIGQILKAGLDAGMVLQDFLYYPRLAKEIVTAEMAIQELLVQSTSINEAALITMDLVSNARALRSYVIDRIFQKAVASKKSIFKK